MKGLSIIELLLSLSLFGILLSISIPTFLIGSTRVAAQQKRLEHEQKTLKVKEELIYSIQKAREAFPLHNSLTITDSNKQLPQRLRHLKNSHRPKTGSSILIVTTGSSLSALPSLPLSNSPRFESLASTEQIVFCSQTPVSPSSQSQLFALVTLNSSKLHRGVLRPSPESRRGCKGYTVRFKTKKGHLDVRPLFALPIKDRYALYVDRDNTFRRVSLVNQDNQPIVRGVHGISIIRPNKKNLPSQGHILSVTTESTTLQGPVKNYYLNTNVNSPKTHPLDFLPS